VTLVCEYCGSTIVRSGLDLKLVGKVSAIVDNGSPVLLGSRGSYGSLPFEVVGRLQVSHRRGFWNEWALSFADGTEGWLADALGQFSVTQPVQGHIDTDGLLPFHQLSPGDRLELARAKLTVTDHRRASFRGSEGVLPFEAVPGTEFYSIDLRGPKGEFFTLDYGGNPSTSKPTVYSGRATTIKQMKLGPLRTFEGWT